MGGWFSSDDKRPPQGGGRGGSTKVVSCQEFAVKQRSSEFPHPLTPGKSLTSGIHTPPNIGNE